MTTITKRIKLGDKGYITIFSNEEPDVLLRVDSLGTDSTVFLFPNIKQVKKLIKHLQALVEEQECRNDRD